MQRRDPRPPREPPRRRPRADATQLVVRHLPLARRAAGLIYPRVRGHVAFDEVLALAAAGLAEAAARFDPARGATFATFAWYRVRGTIIDGLRRSTQLPRRTWARLLALRTTADHPAVPSMYILSLVRCATAGSTPPTTPLHRPTGSTARASPPVCATRSRGCPTSSARS